MGGWSINDNWTPGKYNVTNDVIASKVKFFSGALFSWRVSEDYKNSSSHVLLVNIYEHVKAFIHTSFIVDYYITSLIRLCGGYSVILMYQMQISKSESFSYEKFNKTKEKVQFAFMLSCKDIYNCSDLDIITYIIAETLLYVWLDKLL